MGQKAEVLFITRVKGTRAEIWRRRRPWRDLSWQWRQDLSWWWRWLGSAVTTTAGSLRRLRRCSGNGRIKAAA
ncbi:hypothetical protein GUJ93_ZPchr0006g42742 [Zizania palustris]|uniref:Uncharacterized protein n=1 Tax=Zizania palustris TaxID=103762 RepID=A0A8J5SPA3_ZIZPA|nr:hypothetical protein GUJ93_ZPchr0006g42975 [Zizania palustris]KAG8076067.1 hypothetical protein GUJ93_ZPchr0006g42742 [Zizania palustris]